MTVFTQIAHDRVIKRDHGVGRTLVQTLGAYLWLPMTAMGAMLVITAFALGIAQAVIGADLFKAFDATDKATVETLATLNGGLVLLGIGFLLSGISFALARIAGIFRVGGGQVQEATGSEVHTLAMPWTAWAFLMLMMMGLMIVIGGFIVQVVAAVNIHDAWIDATGPNGVIAYKLGRAHTLTTWAGPVQRFGVAALFTGIAFMLATIIHILRFQATRITELSEQRKPAS